MPHTKERRARSQEEERGRSSKAKEEKSDLSAPSLSAMSFSSATLSIRCASTVTCSVTIERLLLMSSPSWKMNSLHRMTLEEGPQFRAMTLHVRV